MAMADVGGSGQFLADSPHKSFGLVWGAGSHLALSLNSSNKQGELLK